MKKLVTAAILFILYSCNHPTDVGERAELPAGSWQSIQRRPRVTISLTGDTTLDTCLCGNVYEFSENGFHRYPVDNTCRDTVTETMFGVSIYPYPILMFGTSWKALGDTIVISRVFCEITRSVFVIDIYDTDANGHQDCTIVTCDTTEIERMRFVSDGNDTILFARDTFVDTCVRM